MNCQEYKGMIEDALDVSSNGELDACIRRHLDHCPECRDYLAIRRREHAAFFAGVNAAYSHLRQPSADFADRLAESVRNRRGVRRGWRRLALPRWALIAASVAAMAGFVFAASVAVDAVFGGGDEAGEGEGIEGMEGIEAMKAMGGAEATGEEVADVAATIPSAPSGSSTQTTDNQQETNQKGETLMSKVKAATAALAAAITAAPLAAANGDEYQFIDPTTYPAANVSYSAQSKKPITINAGALRIAGVSGNLEARSRTKGASAAILLDATKFHGSIIFVL